MVDDNPAYRKTFTFFNFSKQFENETQTNQQCDDKGCKQKILSTL